MPADPLRLPVLPASPVRSGMDAGHCGSPGVLGGVSDAEFYTFTDTAVTDMLRWGLPEDSLAVWKSQASDQRLYTQGRYDRR